MALESCSSSSITPLLQPNDDPQDSQLLLPPSPIKHKSSLKITYPEFFDKFSAWKAKETQSRLCDFRHFFYNLMDRVKFDYIHMIETNPSSYRKNVEFLDGLNGCKLLSQSELGDIDEELQQGNTYRFGDTFTNKLSDFFNNFKAFNDTIPIFKFLVDNADLTDEKSKGTVITLLKDFCFEDADKRVQEALAKNLTQQDVLQSTDSISDPTES